MPLIRRECKASPKGFADVEVALFVILLRIPLTGTERPLNLDD